MRLALLAALALTLLGCGSSDSGGGPTIFTTVDAPGGHGYWIVYDVNRTATSSSTATPTAKFMLQEGQFVPITAVPDAGFHAVWTGTNHDGATGNSNSFTAHDKATVAVGFSL